jgi:low temperature requirement protein LtrA
MLKNSDKIKTHNSKMIWGLLFSVFLIGIVFFLSFAGATGTARVTAALETLRQIVCQFFGALITVCIVLAAIAYAAGNVMGAEAGARAKVWATNLVIGAAIGVVLYLVSPLVLGALSGSSVTGCG